MLKKGNTILVLLLIVVSFFAGYLFFKVKSLEQGTALGTAQQNQPTQTPQRPSELKIKKPDPNEH